MSAIVFFFRKKERERERERERARERRKKRIIFVTYHITNFYIAKQFLAYLHLRLH
jgi:hypothetical protein